MLNKTTPNRRNRRIKVNGTETTAAVIRPLLTEDQVAELLGITPQTLRNARSGGTGGLASLHWVKVGSRVRYRPEAVEQWLAERERSHGRPEAG